MPTSLALNGANFIYRQLLTLQYTQKYLAESRQFVFPLSSFVNLVQSRAWLLFGKHFVTFKVVYSMFEFRAFHEEVLTRAILSMHAPITQTYSNCRMGRRLYIYSLMASSVCGRFVFPKTERKQRWEHLMLPRGGWALKSVCTFSKRLDAKMTLYLFSAIRKYHQETVNTDL